MDLFATALPALADAWALILQPVVLGYLVLGVVMGLAVGVFPGLGGIAGLSLLLPFMFGMEPVLGLALMIGMVAVVPTSDTFSSVLMGIPGSSASQATVLDGFPLARKGQAARALSAAFTASLFGGLVGAVFLTLFIVIARPLVLAFGLPEMLMISILGLSMVAVLAGRVALKGLAAAGLGMLIGTIGVADAGGSLRMASYDFPYLTDGLQLVIVGLGIFAVPEIVSLLRQDRSIAKDAALGAGWMDGVRDWFANKWLSVRCSLIGVVVGVIPGLGGSVVDWIAYGHAVQTTKDKSQFGKGETRGVIGPESSNNATEGGGLVPTLLFGIPGSGSMAIFIGAIALLGSGDIEVGPAMLILLVQMILRPEGDTIFADKEASGEDADAPYGLWGTLAWFAGLIAATYFVGFILALAGFLVIFLRVRAQAPWPKTLILTACGLALMCVCVCAT